MTSTTSAWPYPRLIAHRGGGLMAPENTIAGIRAGQRYGYRGVEFDVMLSGDDVPVLMHDPIFGRTVRGVGTVATTVAADLLRMDAGSWHSPTFAGEPVPTLADVLRFCKDAGIWMNIEIKPANSNVSAKTGQLVAELTRACFAEQIDAGGVYPVLPEFSSFSVTALEAARQAAPEIPRGLLVGEVPDNWLERVQAINAIALHADHRMLTRDSIAAIKATVFNRRSIGIPILAYTVNDPDRVRSLFDWGVDAICTDRIDLIDND